MPYSVIVDNKVLDYHYNKLNDFIYNFSIRSLVQSIFIGQIFKVNRRSCISWTAVSFYKVSELGAVSGFRTRMDAAEFLLKVNGFRQE